MAKAASADADGLALGLEAVNDGKQNLIPPRNTVDVARPELGGEAVAVLIKDRGR
jgi:hypothetical protein